MFLGVCFAVKINPVHSAVRVTYTTFFNLCSGVPLMSYFGVLIFSAVLFLYRGDGALRINAVRRIRASNPP